jgi:hypothetical protein
MYKSKFVVQTGACRTRIQQSASNVTEHVPDCQRVPYLSHVASVNFLLHLVDLGCTDNHSYILVGYLFSIFWLRVVRVFVLSGVLIAKDVDKIGEKLRRYHYSTDTVEVFLNMSLNPFAY